MRYQRRFQPRHGGECPNAIIHELNKALKTTFEPEYFENPFGFYQEETLADTRKAGDLVGFQAEYDLAGGIANYLSTLNVDEFVT